jgi:sugar transport system permease protein
MGGPSAAVCGRYPPQAAGVLQGDSRRPQPSEMTAAPRAMVTENGLKKERDYVKILSRLVHVLRGHILEAVLLVLFAYLSYRDPHFLSWHNFFTILRMLVEPGLIAFGMTLVIISGEIDLSVGSMVAFAGCLLMWFVEQGIPIALAILVTLTAGASIGAFTGVMRTRYQVPTFITTLALLTGLRGAARLLTKGFPLTPDLPPWYIWLGSGFLPGGIPVASFFFLAGLLVFLVLATQTALGRSIYAVGGNLESARLSGINAALVKIIVLAATAALASLSGIILAARMSSGNPDVGLGMELEVIAAVIVGGTSFTGGQGTIWGTLLGLAFLGVLKNGMTMLNIPLDGQYVATGALILIAVLVNRLNRTR